MEDDFGVKESDRYINAFGKSYEIMRDCLSYCETIKRCGAKAVIAVKGGYVIARVAKADEDIVTFCVDNSIESTTVATAGSVILTKADEFGKPIVDGNGHADVWFVSMDLFKERYDTDNVKAGPIRPKRIEQEFVQTDRNIAIMKPWGDNGQDVPQLIAKGGYVNISNRDDIYGISEHNFNDTYEVVKEVIIDRC